MKAVVGMVVSNKMQKSVVVAVDRLFHHKLFNRYVKRTSKFMAHDETNQCNIAFAYALQCFNEMLFVDPLIKCQRTKAFLGEGAGGRVFIPRGSRYSGWDALLSVLGSVSSSLQSVPKRGHTAGEMQGRSAVRMGWCVKPREGLEYHIDKDECSSKVVIDLDAVVFHNWVVAVVCSICAPKASDDWVVSKIISKLLPKEESVTIFPFEAHRAIYHTKKESHIAVLCSSKPNPVGNCNVVGLRRWWPAANSLSFTGFSKPRWLAVKGIPFHIWVPEVLGKVGALCGELMEVHPSTVDFSDLSFAKIKKFRFGRMNFAITIRCGQKLEIWYYRSWVEGAGGLPGQGETRVPMGLEAINNGLVVISNSNFVRVESDLLSATLGRVYGANERMEVAHALPEFSNWRMDSAVQFVGKKRGKRQAKNRKRSIRRQRYQRQRRLGEPAPQSGGLLSPSGREKGIRAVSSRGVEEVDMSLKGLVTSNKECLIGPTSIGPNPVVELLNDSQVGLVEEDHFGIET
ncbi:hypothetical protein HHK36_026205 [Tetracentron sinense]|uniref:DUF4283 domain-containing protein n=1 Tax=Tetracentron sinense TaxID=13715 RepID=A0A834YK56_TETSI|nr:hypothetical protein HHK36_026205 [Tetracentron sinense]